jgi:antitoxin (DNA-binding transcriptional repressor) of toxin-antitoxin stability system
LLEVNFKFKFIFMKTVTMLEFRRDARKALAAVRRGERLLLTYRGRAVAQLSPVTDTAETLPADDALRSIDAFAIDGPGGDLTNQDIDGLLYGARDVR